MFPRRGRGGGGFPASFVETVHEIGGLNVVTAPMGGLSLVGQIRAAIQAAAKLGCRYLLYTEPDKEAFFADDLTASAGSVVGRGPGMVVAAWNADSFATFPEG